MAFELIAEQSIVKDSQTYTIRLYDDLDTSTQRQEYVLDNEILFHLEYEFHYPTEPAEDTRIEAIVNGFELWYDQFGPDWRPEPF